MLGASAVLASGLAACASPEAPAPAPAAAGSADEAPEAATQAETPRELQRLRTVALLHLGLDATLRADDFDVVPDADADAVVVRSRAGDADQAARAAALLASLPDGARFRFEPAVPPAAGVEPIDVDARLAAAIALATRREIEPEFVVEGSGESVINRAASGDRPRTWRVRPGETLSLIAARAMGDGNQWQRIYELNRSVIGANPERLREGMELRIPQD
jgi:nucleoid-associated protein YgaU